MPAWPTGYRPEMRFVTVEEIYSEVVVVKVHINMHAE